MGLNLPTGIPFVYELDENMKPIVSMKFLGDEETVRKAIESVAAQVMIIEMSTYGLKIGKYWHMFPEPNFIPCPISFDYKED